MVGGCKRSAGSSEGFQGKSSVVGRPRQVGACAPSTPAACVALNSQTFNAAVPCFGVQTLHVSRACAACKLMCLGWPCRTRCSELRLVS